ncbi:MAG: tetratricopeptide repeat protein, partial [Pirellulaceae bacterium]
MSVRHVAIAGLLLSGLGAEAAAADVKSLIQSAYAKTTSASTMADYDSIIALCEEARTAGPDASQQTYLRSLLSWAHNRRGELLTEQASQLQERGEAERAAELDGKALADFELSIQLDRTRWKPWHNRGVSRAIAGKYDDAISDFTQVIELNPTYANAWFNRAEIRFDLGKLEEALDDYAEAIRLDPRDSGAYTSRAHTYFRLARYDEALRDYSEAIKLNPQDATALANRGDAYQSLGKWPEAAEDLNQAVRLQGDSARVLQSAAWLMATCPDERLRNPQIAIQAAERAVSLLGQPDARYLDTLAAAYANAGQFAQAVAKMQE